MQAKLRPINDAELSFPGFQRILDFTVPAADSYTKLLLHMNGADGAQVFYDECGRTVTPIGTAATQPSIKKFGYSSASFNGLSAALSIPSSTDFDYGTGDFTIDCWVRLNSIPTSGKVNMMYARGQDGTHYSYFYISDSGGTKQLAYFNRDVGATPTVIGNITAVLTAQAWHHVAIVRASGVGTVYFNGVAINSADLSHDVGAYTAAVGIGKSIMDDTYFFDGNIDEFRISKGIARWTADFTPPTSEYTDSYATYNLAVDGDTDKEYKILYRTPGSGANYVCMRLNYDAGTKYGRQILVNDGGTITAGRYGSESMWYTQNSRVGGLYMWDVLTPAGFIKTALHKCISTTGTTVVDAMEEIGNVYNSTANTIALSFGITGFVFPMPAGTNITVFARRSQS